jgi:hypothetical protein
MRILTAHSTCWLRRDESAKRTRSSHLELMCLAKYLELNRTPHVIATRLRNAHDAQSATNKTHVGASSRYYWASAQHFSTLPTGWLLRAFRQFTSRETDAMLRSIQKTSWADDVEDLGEHSESVSSSPHLFLDQSKGEDYTDDNGIRTTIEYAVNEEGKKVKVCRGGTTSALSLIRTDHEEDKANSAKVASGACRSRAKNMGQVRARKGQKDRPRWGYHDGRRDCLSEAYCRKQGSMQLTQSPPFLFTHAQAVSRIGTIGTASHEDYPFEGRRWEGRL